MSLIIREVDVCMYVCMVVVVVVPLSIIFNFFILIFFALPRGVSLHSSYTYSTAPTAQSISRVEANYGKEEI